MRQFVIRRSHESQPHELEFIESNSWWRTEKAHTDAMVIFGSRILPRLDKTEPGRDRVLVEDIPALPPPPWKVGFEA